jgi:hypothetical protein
MKDYSFQLVAKEVFNLEETFLFHWFIKQNVTLIQSKTLNSSLSYFTEKNLSKVEEGYYNDYHCDENCC